MSGRAGSGRTESYTRDPQRRAEARERLERRRREREEAAREARPARGKRGKRRGRPSRGRERRPLTRPTRGQALRRRWFVLGTVALLAALVVVALFTPVLGVHTVRVEGTHALSAAKVRAAARIEPGTPILRVDTEAAGKRVSGLSRVASVSVSTSLPFTVTIDVTERSPVAIFEATDGIRLVDRTGHAYATVKKAPDGLPRINLPKVAAGDPATEAVVGVLTALPGKLRDRVTSITASREGDVRFALAGGKKVRWGSTEQSKRKAAVLRVLLSREGTVYNVTSPALPGVS